MDQEPILVPQWLKGSQANTQSNLNKNKIVDNKIKLQKFTIENNENNLFSISAKSQQDRFVTSDLFQEQDTSPRSEFNDIVPAFDTQKLASKAFGSSRNHKYRNYLQHKSQNNTSENLRRHNKKSNSSVINKCFVNETNKNGSLNAFMSEAQPNNGCKEGDLSTQLVNNRLERGNHCIRGQHGDVEFSIDSPCQFNRRHSNGQVDDSSQKQKNVWRSSKDINLDTPKQHIHSIGNSDFPSLSLHKQVSSSPFTPPTESSVKRTSTSIKIDRQNIQNDISQQLSYKLSLNKQPPQQPSNNLNNSSKSPNVKIEPVPLSVASKAQFKNIRVTKDKTQDMTRNDAIQQYDEILTPPAQNVKSKLITLGPPRQKSNLTVEKNILKSEKSSFNIENEGNNNSSQKENNAEVYDDFNIQKIQVNSSGERNSGTLNRQYSQQSPGSVNSSKRDMPSISKGPQQTQSGKQKLQERNDFFQSLKRKQTAQGSTQNNVNEWSQAIGQNDNEAHLKENISQENLNQENLQNNKNIQNYIELQDLINQQSHKPKTVLGDQQIVEGYHDAYNQRQRQQECTIQHKTIQVQGINFIEQQEQRNIQKQIINDDFINEEEEKFLKQLGWKNEDFEQEQELSQDEIQAFQQQMLEIKQTNIVSDK